MHPQGWPPPARAALLAGLMAASQISHPSGQQAQPTFRSQVNLVTLDVIPRTADGRFVSDLGKDDFEIKDDGTVQTVASLVLVHGGRVFNVLQAPTATPDEIGRAHV